MTRSTQSINIENFQRWLAPLETAPLECDGLSRAIGLLLHRERIDHKLMVGALSVEGVGDIDLHFWIELSDGYVCDYRSRLWLGDKPNVPHGIFKPSSNQRYIVDGQLNSAGLSPALFKVLTGLDFDGYPSLGVFKKPSAVASSFEP